MVKLLYIGVQTSLYKLVCEVELGLNSLS